MEKKKKWRDGNQSVGGGSIVFVGRWDNLPQSLGVCGMRSGN